MPRAPLPPFSALRAFEAAARLGSLRDAAAELGVTPSAVSHQVRILEEWLGSPVFLRTVRAVQPTPAGAALAGELAAAFDRIAAGSERAKAAGHDRRLAISALPLFTNVWLAPRLPQFQAAHADLAISVDTTNRVVDLAAEDVDVAIRNVYAPTPGLTSRKLLDLKALPVCTAALATRLGSPADLAGVTLIHISARRAGWADWLAAAGHAGLKPRADLSFDTIPAALEATVRGRGVLLGLDPLVWDAPGAETLVAPFAGPVLSAGTYFLVHRKADGTRASVRAFADWITAEMRRDARRLARRSQARQARP